MQQKRLSQSAPTNELQIPTNNPPPNISGTNSSAGLRLNFRGVPLEMVLDYLSDAAGFIIVLDTPVSGRVDLWSDQPVTKDEAVDLLNSVLNKNGYAAIRDGRKLTIVSKNDAKTRDIPVKSGNDPAAFPKTTKLSPKSSPSGLSRPDNWPRICRHSSRRRRRLSPTRPAIRLSSPTPSRTSGI